MRLVCMAHIPNDHERACIRDMFCKVFATAYHDDENAQVLYAEYHGEVEEIRHAFCETFSKYQYYSIELKDDM